LVSLQDLNENLVIQAYVGLDRRFSHLSDDNCRWLMHNFNGATAKIARAGKEGEILISKLMPGDVIYKIYKFPKELKHLIFPTDKLLKSLQARKFLQFEVAQRPKGKSPQHAQKVAEASQLVLQVRKSYNLKSKATKLVENIMDHAGQGAADVAPLGNYVDAIVKDNLTDAMCVMAPLKQSSHTYAHCVDVAAIFAAVYFRIVAKKGRKSAFQGENEALLSGMLHDIGKGIIPKEVLESSTKYEKGSAEFEMMRRHPIESKKMLDAMGMSKIMQNMALCHHIKSSGSGYSHYPEGMTYDQASYEAKLLGIIDVYQSLIGNRPYKKAWTAPSAMRYIESLAGIDYAEEIWEDFRDCMGLYPKGSLVKLSDESVGFVVSLPEADPTRPQITLIKDAEGNRPTKQELIDLNDLPDLSIAQDLDPQETLQGKALEYFANLKIA